MVYVFKIAPISGLPDMKNRFRTFQHKNAARRKAGQLYTGNYKSKGRGSKATKSIICPPTAVLYCIWRRFLLMEAGMTEEERIAELRRIIRESNNIVFFGGAGVSTESGIPDFRSVDGLYNQKYDYPPETILSHTFYERKPEEFYRFYRDKLLSPLMDPATKPNKAHLTLAKWEKEGKLKAVVTQNIDGLHQAAGSKNVLELHGSVMRNRCERCGRRFDGMDEVRKIAASKDVPTCSCGGRIKPDVVLYEEGLDMDTMESAVSFIRNADVLIIGGTSLAVYPAAGLIDYYRGNKLILINKTATPRDAQADLVIQGAIGEVLFSADAD